MEKLLRFVKDDEGVTAIEYGLIAAGIGIAISAVVWLVGTELVTLFTTVDTKLSNPPPS
jgi:pilus assembly protein Flp/PilA